MLQAFTNCNFVFVLLSECCTSTLTVAGRGRQSMLPSSYWDVLSESIWYTVFRPV